MSESITQGDIKFYQTAPEFADIRLAAADNSEVILDDGLENYVLISLSTNKRARDIDPLPFKDSDKQGWWGDIFEDVEIGSRLWLRQRDRISNELFTNITQDVEDALQWMIDDNIIDRLSVSVERSTTRNNEVLISILAEKDDEGQIGFSYYFNWINQVFRRGTIDAI